MADADVNNLLYIRNEPPPLPTRGRSLHQGCEGPGPGLCAAVQGLCITLADVREDARLQTDPNVSQNATFTDNYTVG